ncbi:hypothetical protein ONE63_009586 [Megalurothrips usitatus]|uniref:C2H2-type domain-containing protein n=1 Tax=Megalurothrips usitatus TaxID=439358 RepID=A0AAV7XP73_9NEOP|nr:hypothetical protein ONE63_009586 [Megalurothrips usitatus]
MDNDLQELLDSWGVDSGTTQRFKDNLVCRDSLLELTEEDLREIVPAIGPRSLIRRRINMLKRGEGEVNNNSSHGISLSKDQQDLFDDILSSHDEGLHCTTSPDVGSTTILTSTGSSPSVSSADLEAVLKKYPPKGEVVLSSKKSEKPLTHSTRSMLAECVVNYEINGDLEKRITSERAKFLGGKILEMFPSEILTTWFRQTSRPDGSGQECKGRIMSRFYTVRRTLLKAGAISAANFAEGSDDESVFLDEDDPEGFEESLAYLKGKNIQPWTRVRDAWIATSKHRRRHLVNGAVVAAEQEAQKNDGRKGKKPRRAPKRSPEDTVMSYVADYPQIKQPKGWTLLEQDFELYQPQSVLKLTSEIGKLTEFVVHKLGSDDIVSEETDECIKQTRILLSLSKLFQPITIATKLADGSNNKDGLKNWRPSRAEMRDSFLLHVKSEADLKSVLEARRKKLGDFNLTCQPIAVIVGSAVDDIEKCHVVVDDYKYTLETPLKAIDIVFKIYHALHAVYPPESEPLWLFLQLAVYKFSTSVGTLKIHLRFNHLDVFRKYGCGEGCQQYFDHWKGLRQHLVKVHNGLVVEVPNNLNLNSVTLPLVDSNTEVLNSFEVPNSDLPEISVQDFHSSLHSSVECLVAKLYQNPIIPRNHVQSVLDDYSEFLAGGFIDVIQAKLKTFFSGVRKRLHVDKSADCSNEAGDEILHMLEALKCPFEGFSTDYRRMKYFESNCYYVAPESFIISEHHPKLFNTNNGPLIKLVKTTGQFVKLRHLFQNLFELPGAFSETMKFIDSLKADKGFVSNFVQCQMWQKKLSYFNESDIVIPVDFYYDELEANSDLGPHSEKLGAGYVGLPTLPPFCQSKLENIFLALLIDAADRKSDAPELKPALTWKFLSLFALFEDLSLFRDPDNYSDDVLVSNVTETGIKEECVFNQVRSYHVTGNMALDIMHDWAEGISHYVLIPALKHFIESRYFTLDNLNSRMFFFDYGVDCHNKPSGVKDGFFSKSKLKFTAAEMFTFVRVLGVLVGDLVPESDKYWQLYKIHKSIVEILQSRRLPVDIAPELNVLISEHHSLYLELTGLHLTPKFHNCIHYGSVINASGPLVHFSSMRPEGKHRFLKEYLNSISCRKDLPRSAAVKHQLSQCFRFVSKAPLKPLLICGPEEIMDLEEHLHFLSLRSWFKSETKVTRCNWVDFMGTRYKPRMVLIIGANEDGYKFGKIVDILLYNKQPLFVCKVLVSMGYCDHVGGHEVKEGTSIFCTPYSNLLDPFPVYDFSMFSGEKVVVLKHSVY